MTRSLLRFTDKAVERYITWFEPDLTHDQARIDLETAALRAVNTHNRSIAGDADIWQIDSLDLQLVVRAAKDDPQGAGTVVGLVPPWAMDRQREHLERATMQAEEALASARKKLERATEQQAYAKEIQAQADAKHLLERSEASKVAVNLAKSQRQAAQQSRNDAQLEATVLTAVCKTARMRMMDADDRRQMVHALRVAVLAIQAYDYTDPLTIQREREAALAEISQAFPAAITEDFLCQRRKRT